MKTLIKILLLFSIALVSCTQLDTPVDTSTIRPVLKEKPKLIYPISAQQENQTGICQVLFTISKEGKVTETLIRKSSGHPILDKAAVNYCKGLVFTPAIIDGEPAEYGMRQDIKFNLEDLSKDIRYRVSEVKDLYEDAYSANSVERLKIQNEVLRHHNYIVDQIRDCNKFNEYVYNVVLSKNKIEWESSAKSCPLSFLLYHDYLMRFSDYSKIDSVYLLLEYSLKKDLDYINISENPEVQRNRVQLVKKIRSFVEGNYPMFKIDYPEVDLKVKNNNLS